MSFQTWSDLNDPSLIPPLGGHHQPDLGTVALMVSTAPDFRYIESNIGKISSKQPFFMANLILIEQNSNLIKQDSKNRQNDDINRRTDHISSTDTISSKVAVTGPYLGAPAAVMILESLIARGVKKVVVVGWCGAISDHLQTGDILIPDSAISDEGTSRNYIQMPSNTDFPTLFPCSELSQKLKSNLEVELSRHNSQNSTITKEGTELVIIESEKRIYCKTGKIWTTDAIYRETSKKIAFFKDMGAIAVEMECSALFAVGQYRKIDIASILVVSDTLTSNEWRPGFKELSFKESRKRLLGSITSIIKKIH